MRFVSILLHTCHGAAMTSFTAIALVLSTTPTAPEPDVPNVKPTVEKGLKWLAAQQNKDGTWSNPSKTLTVNITSYAGLALLMEGSTLQDGQFAENLRRAVEWFLKIARPNGLLVPADDATEEDRYMQSHCAALLFLASAYESDDDSTRRQRLKSVLEKAVTFAVEGQTNRGGWSLVSARDSGGNDETYSTVFMVQALFASEKAGLKVPPRVFEKTAKYLSDATNSEGGIIYLPRGGFAPQGGDGQPVATAAGAAAFLLAPQKPPTLGKWVAYSRPLIPPFPQPSSRVELNARYLQDHLAAARLVHALGDTRHRKFDPVAHDLLRWSDYRTTLFPHVA